MTDPPHPLAHFEQRVRVLAEVRLPADRVEETVRRILDGLADELEAVPDGVEPGTLADRVYRRARAVIEGVDAGADSETDDPPVLLRERGEAGDVARCLARLDDADREILRMAYRDGLSPGEIADRLDLSPDEACRRKRYALDRFTEIYRATADE